MTDTQGITPADAGTSIQRRHGSALDWDHPRGCGDKHVYTSCNQPITDHPRGCGDKCIFRYRSLLLSGSPPRMRGQVRSAAGS